MRRAQLLTGTDEFRTVDAGEMFALVDGDAGEVDKEFVNTRRETGGQRTQARLVVIKLTDQTNGDFGKAPLDARRLDVGQRAGALAHDQSARAVVGARFARPDGDECHRADRTFTGTGSPDLWVHGAGPNLGLGPACGDRVRGSVAGVGITVGPESVAPDEQTDDEGENEGEHRAADAKGFRPGSLHGFLSLAGASAGDSPPTSLSTVASPCSRSATARS